MQLELESERAKVKDLKNSVERKKQRLQSQVTAHESQTSVLKDELEQERLPCREMMNEIDQIQLQKLKLTWHYEHERDQVSRLKSKHELLRSGVKSLKDVMNEKERSRDMEKVTECRSQRQLERERDDQNMKMHENELEIHRLTQRVLDLKDKVSETREREMEATRELQQEKLRSTHQRVDSEASEEDPDHWNIYKSQLKGKRLRCFKIRMIQRLYGKYLRADSYRKALVYQKKYLLLLLGGFQDCEQTTLALIARMGVYPSLRTCSEGPGPADRSRHLGVLPGWWWP
uniref:Pericentrin n=1 Tax=Magallana gigas TaxID=29159 RepID=K1Q771_MAGGI